jgi:hypothetical protein
LVEERLGDLERRLQNLGARVRRGGSSDGWDLEVRGGLFGSVRLLMALEEHGWGRQMVRARSWPALSRVALQLSGALLAAAAVLMVSGHVLAAAALALAMALVGIRAFFDCSAATGTILAEQRARHDWSSSPV